MSYGFTCELWAPQRMTRPDRHNEIELNYVLEGAIVYLFGGRTVTVKAGHLCAFWASTPHQIISSDGETPYFVATVPLAWTLACQIEGSMVERLLNGEILIEELGTRARLDFELFQQWSTDLGPGESTRRQIALQEIEARLHRLSLSVKNPEDKRPSETHRVAGAEKSARMALFIAQNYTERLSVDLIAKDVGLHPNYAMELFRRTFGTSLIDYVNHHRVTHAQRLLVTTNESILEIAFCSGFNSLSRFNAVFKSFSGCTPRNYRISHRLA